MYTLSISNESQKKLEKIGEIFGKLEYKIVKEALRESIKIVKKADREAIKKRYSANKEVYSAKNFKSKVTDTEAVLLGSTKRTKVNLFAISKPFPGKSTNYISTEIVKGKNVSWKTLFWAFWKKGNPKLMFRVGNDRYKITLATSISTRVMGMQLDDDFLFNKVQETFTEVLEKRIEEVL